MRFLKFVTKTAVITAICSMMFSTVLEKTLNSQAKENIKNASSNIVNLISKEESTESMESVEDKHTLYDNVDILNDAEVNEEDIVNNDVPENILTNKNDNFIFIGDSRTVAYKDIVEVDKYDFVTFISEDSIGHDWLEKTAIEKLNTRFETTDLNYNVILNLGINDLENIDKYINTYNELANKNPKHNFFVVSLNKVNTEEMIKNGYNKMENSNIEEFNINMKKSLASNIHFIDTYSYYKDKDLYTNDGLHYTKNSSSDILNYISDYIKSL